MKKLLFFVLLLLAIGSAQVFSQLSDRVNSPSTFKVGTRPVMGNYGLFFGLAYNELAYWFDHDIDYNGIPIVSIKYYRTDNNVWRIGFQTSTTNEILKGKIDPLINGGTLEERKMVDNTSRFTAYPGYEHHFTGNNLLDVYMGTVIPFGWDRRRYVDNDSYNNGDYNEYSLTRTSLTYGLEGFVGVQAFVADLPLAIGADFGAALLGHAFDRYKHRISSEIGTLITDQVYYTVNEDGSGIKYETLSRRDFQLQGNIRITLTYFFKK
jgi:hypothetical protein